MDQFNIQNLPNEVLQEIFSYLPVKCKMSYSLVCKQWFELMNTPRLLGNVYFVFKKNVYRPCFVFEKKKDGIESFSFSRKFSNFKFTNFILTRQHFTFLKEYSANIKSLTFRNCSISHEITDVDHENVGCFSNLRILEFYDCFFCFVHTVPKLKRLCISSRSSILTDRSLSILNATMPSLEMLELAHPIASKRVVINRFYPNSTKWHENASDLILTYPALHDFIKIRAKTLTCFHINDPLLQGAAISETFQIENLKLKILSLRGCLECVNATPQLCRYQSFLTVLELYCMPLVNDDIIASICTLLPSLERLCISSNKTFNQSISSIFQLKQLRTLELDNCTQIKSESFDNALCDFKLHKLAKLALIKINITEKSLKCILERTIHLRRLLFFFSCRLSQETRDYISQRGIVCEYFNEDDILHEDRMKFYRGVTKVRRGEVRNCYSKYQRR